ncbi:hypothetical protein M422DRAFT_249695, partial [Sphaerobolus stellatus SS14]
SISSRRTASTDDAPPTPRPDIIEEEQLQERGRTPPLPPAPQPIPIPSPVNSPRQLRDDGRSGRKWFGSGRRARRHGAVLDGGEGARAGESSQRAPSPVMPIPVAPRGRSPTPSVVRASTRVPSISPARAVAPSSPRQPSLHEMQNIPSQASPGRRKLIPASFGFPVRRNSGKRDPTPYPVAPPPLAPRAPSPRPIS